MFPVGLVGLPALHHFAGRSLMPAIQALSAVSAARALRAKSSIHSAPLAVASKLE